MVKSHFFRILLFLCLALDLQLTVSADDSNFDVQRQMLMDRRASLLRMGDPKFFGFSNPHVRSHDILAATALLGCKDEAWASYMVELPNLPSSGEPTEMFSLPPLVRYLYQFGHCFSELQKQTLLSKLSKRESLLDHGTTNHAIVKASSWYLLAQYFPEAVWTDYSTNKSFTSSQLMAALKPLLVARTKGIFRSGHYEWLSPTYAIVNEYPLLNLIDFALDKEIKQNAIDEATLEIAVLREHSFHGVVVPPLTRRNFNQRNALETPQTYEPSASQLMLWYYFGEPAGLGLYDFRSGSGPFIISMLGISSWLPADAALRIDPAAPNVGDVASAIPTNFVTPRFSNWGAITEPEIVGDSLITDDFAIGTGNVFFDPYGYSGHIQTFSILLKSSKPRNEIECYQPFWHGSAGEDAWGTDRSSPFQQMYRYDQSSVVMLFDIPAKDPWANGQNNRFWADRSARKDALLQVVTCRIANEFDEIIEEPNWVFIRHGEVFVAIATLLGINEYDSASVELTRKYKVLKVRQARTALFFRVDKQTAEMNFAQFRESVRKNLPTYDAKNSTIKLVERNGVQTQVKFDLHKQGKSNFWSAIPEITSDGRTVTYDSSYTIRSPNLTLRQGTLRIKSFNGDLLISH